VACLIFAIAAAIRAKLNPSPSPADIRRHHGGHQPKVLDELDYRVDMPAKPAPVMDLSKIDFEALAQRFKLSKHRNTDLEVLKAAIRAQMEKLIRLNRTRVDFQQKFEELDRVLQRRQPEHRRAVRGTGRLSRSLSDEQQRTCART
jgi:type I restriction enzyme R subunit